MSTYHAIAPNRQGGFELRFGASALISSVWASQLAVSHDSEKQRWPFRRIDDGFAHLQTASRSFALKLECAASLYANRADEYGRGVTSWNRVQDEDLAILLDAILVYVRLIPDLIAEATAYFYRHPKPPSRSFRDQLKWFLENPDADPGYATILTTLGDWWTLLAGRDGKGVRDLLIHRFGKFQFPVTTSPGDDYGRVSADLVSKAGYHANIDVLLPRIMLGMSAFLDQWLDHFSRRIREQGGWEVLGPAGDRQVGIMNWSYPPPSKWLFPTLGLADQKANSATLLCALSMRSALTDRGIGVHRVDSDEFTHVVIAGYRALTITTNFRGPIPEWSTPHQVEQMVRSAIDGLVREANRIDSRGES